jgi:TusA-related sulfurtransferase
MAEIIVVIAIAFVVALPALGAVPVGGGAPVRPGQPVQPVQPVQPQPPQQLPAQPQTESLDNVKFAKFSVQGVIGIVQGVDANNRNGMWKIGSRHDVNNNQVPNQDMIDVVNDLKPGDLLKITATIKGADHWIDSVSREPITFEKVTEAASGATPKVTVTIKMGDKSDTLLVPNVKDKTNKLVADPAIMAQINEFKEGDKIEFTRQAGPAGQVVIKTIKLAGAPDKAEFIKTAEKTIAGEKFAAIEIKEGADKPITLLVPNTKDANGKAAKDAHGNPVPDATMIDAIKAMTPGQMVEYKSKTDNSNRVVLTEIKAVAPPASQPADAPAGGGKAAG